MVLPESRWGSERSRRVIVTAVMIVVLVMALAMAWWLVYARTAPLHQGHFDGAFDRTNLIPAASSPRLWPITLVTNDKEMGDGQV